MRYLDSNLFIYAALYTDERGEKARDYIEKIRKGDEKAITSALTFDEVFWKLKEEKGFEEALKLGKSFLEMNNLLFVEVNDQVLWRSYQLIKKHKLDPRNAIHLSCSLEKGVRKIISEDKDFDDVGEVERDWIL